MNLDSYSGLYETIRFRREDDILEMTFHTDGDSLRWGALPVREMQDAFLHVSRDTENRVVILAGLGDEFIGPKGSPDSFPKVTARSWESGHWNDRKLLGNLLDIEAPVIAAINGPVWRHCETPLLSDIIIASETAVFQDSGHFINGLVPGDGLHLVMQLVMGPVRARYFMLTGQEVDAATALTYGMINEVLPPDQVLPRAWDIARRITEQSPLVTRYTRIAFVHQIKQYINQYQGYGLMLEGMAAIDDADKPGYELESRI